MPHKSSYEELEHRVRELQSARDVPESIPAARELFGDRVGKRCYKQLHLDFPCPQCPAPVLLQSGSADPVHSAIEAFSRALEGTMSTLDRLEDLQLLARFHDLGKVAMPDHNPL